MRVAYRHCIAGWVCRNFARVGTSRASFTSETEQRANLVQCEAQISRAPNEGELQHGRGTVLPIATATVRPEQKSGALVIADCLDVAAGVPGQLAYPDCLNLRQ
jgi:hypothetical protein